MTNYKITLNTIKYYSAKVSEHAAIAYWQQGDRETAYHLKEMVVAYDRLREALLEMKKMVDESPDTL